MGNRIREHLASANLTQAWLAARLACTPMAVSYYVSGQRCIDLQICRQIVRALNDAGVACTLDEVFPPDVVPTATSAEAAA
ncbi:MAG: helix-turn-helix transcriptional regulator [Methylomonas sp.]|nr:helix-turn-helix transcriptional regulator [Methylomonas sp.]